MNHDTTPAIGAAGTLATIGLTNINALVSLLVGLATLGYILTKWFFLIRSRREKPEED